MEQAEVHVSPPNSLVVVGDPQGNVPESYAGGLIAATESCILVGTLAEMDGETTVRLARGRKPSDCPEILAFERRLTIPSRHLVIGNVLRDVYMERSLETDSPTVQIWVNHGNEPDIICIVVN